MNNKTLTLVRHAHAEMYAENDYRRALSAVGKQQAVRTGEFLATTAIPYQRIFASAAKRTAETAQLIAEVLQYEDKIWESRAWYNASLSDVIPMLEDLPATIHHGLLVLHHPTL